jgi:hypothetical protein
MRRPPAILACLELDLELDVELDLELDLEPAGFLAFALKPLRKRRASINVFKSLLVSFDPQP